MKRIIIITSILFNFYFVYLTLIYKQYPYSKIATTYNSLKMNIKSSFNSDDEQYKFIRKSQSNTVTKDKVQKIETNYLPLDLNYVNLSSIGFAKAGGAIASINEKEIILMDRLGYFYKYDSTLTKSKIKVPNNLLDFTKSYEGDRNIGTTTLRAFKIVFASEKNQIIASYSRYDSKNNIVIVVSTINLSDFNNGINKWTDLFVSDSFENLAHSSQSGGGAIAVNNSFVYLTIGYADDELENKMSGKVIKINLENKKVQEITRGHRNSQGIVILDNGNIIATEHGPQGGDEINILKKGGHYGWPYLSYGTDYGKFNTYLEDLNSSSYISPLFSFIPSIGISSIVQLNSFDKKWKGNLLVGSLKAMTLKRLLLKENRIVYSEDIFIGERIRDIIEVQNKIYLLTDNSNIVEITLDKEKLKANMKGDGLASLNTSLVKCTSCHSFSNTNNSFGPSLENIKNRKIGSSNYDKYSSALKNYNGFWTQQNMESFLKDPQKFIQGSKMPNQNLSDLEIKQILKTIYDL